MIHSCLNRLQLANNLQMVNLADPIGSFQMAPTWSIRSRARPRWLDQAEADAVRAARGGPGEPRAG